MVVKSTSCSLRGHSFNSQHLHGLPQLSEIPVPGEPTPFSGLCGHQALTWYPDMLTDKPLTKNFKNWTTYKCASAHTFINLQIIYVYLLAFYFMCPIN